MRKGGGVRDSETDRDKHGHRGRETARQTETERERRDFQGGNIHMREREKKREHKA